VHISVRSRYVGAFISGNDISLAGGYSQGDDLEATSRIVDKAFAAAACLRMTYR